MRVSRALARVLTPANLPLQAIDVKGYGEGAPRASAALRARRPRSRGTRRRDNDGVGEAGMMGLESGNDNANTARANDNAVSGIARMANQESAAPPEKRRPILYNIPQKPNRQPTNN